MEELKNGFSISWSFKSFLLGVGYDKDYGIIFHFGFVAIEYLWFE